MQTPLDREGGGGAEERSGAFTSPAGRFRGSSSRIVIVVAPAGTVNVRTLTVAGARWPEISTPYAFSS